MSIPDLAGRRRVVAELDKTLLVEASAGTGKTALIVGRIVRLLAEGVPTGEVAAITFTERAAGELLGRVEEYLSELVAGRVPTALQDLGFDTLDASQREALALAEQTLDEMVCSTIHSFCQRIVSTYPVEAELDPGAQVMDEMQAAATYASLLRDWLWDLFETENPTAEGRVLAELMEGGTGAALALIEEIAQFMRRYRTARVPKTNPGEGLRAFEGSVEALVAWQRGHGLVEEKTEAVIAALVSVRDQCRLAHSPPYSASVLRNLIRKPDPVLFTKQHQIGKFASGTKGKWVAVDKTRGAGLSAEFEQLANDARDSLQVVYDELNDVLAAQVFPALQGVLEVYQKYKRDSALLDFDDLLYKARDLLRRHPEVRASLAGQYTRILVDEFQDTDPLQAETLFLLAGEDAEEWIDRPLRPGQLFLVGDPKQAIYRFRGADIVTYQRVKQALPPESIVKVSNNFRSSPGVLEFANTRFAGPLEAPGQPGYVALDGSNAPCAQGWDAEVFQLPIAAPEEIAKGSMETRRRAEAARVAEWCASAIGSLQVWDGRERRPCRPSDIALLAPTGTDLWIYEWEMEHLGVPILSQAGKGLFQRQEVKDLIAVARVLANPRDNLALLALLRGPLVGLTESEILDLVDESGGDRPKLRLFFQAEPKHPVARQTLNVLRELRGDASSMTPFELLSKAVEALRMRAILSNRHRSGRAERALANVDHFLEMARPFSVRGLDSFAATMERAWKDNERYPEGRPDSAEDSVSVLTMHAAKGLEWPVVVLINTMTAVRNQANILLRREDDTVHLKFGKAPNASYDAVLDEEKRQLDLERKRVLYVASTRAREVMVVPRHEELKPGAWASQVNLGLEELPEVPSLPRVAPPTVEIIASDQSPERFAEGAARVAMATVRLSWIVPSDGDDARLDTGDALEDAFPMHGSAVRGGIQRGLVLHRLLEEILTGESNPGELEARAEDLLRELGTESFAEPADGPCASELAGCVERVLALPEVAPHRPSLVAEIPVYGKCGDNPLFGFADAASIDDSGMVQTVFDWKSDVNPNAEARAAHRSQVRLYMEALGASEGYVVYATNGLVDRV